MLRETSRGCLLDVEVVPNARAFEVVGPDAWTKRLRIKLVSAATKNRANEELAARLGELLGCGVKLVAGGKTRKKTLLLGIGSGEATRRLSDAWRL